MPRLRAGWLEGSDCQEGREVDLLEMAAPPVIPKVHPEQVVEDILISTLIKVQKHSSRDVSRAAAKYLELLKGRML